MPAARPSQAAIERAIRAWMACGSPGRGVRVGPDGSVTILAGPPEEPVASPPSDEAEDAWDRALGLGG